MKKIEIKKISCCGANETLDANDVVKFLIKNPNTEIGVSISDKCFYRGQTTLHWVCNVMNKLNDCKVPHGYIALHLNGNVPKDVVESGSLNKALDFIVSLSGGKSRIQINFTERNAKADLEDIKILSNVFSLLEDLRPASLILPYDENSKKLITMLSKITPDFDILYDSSYGLGKVSSEYKSLFPNQLQGYCGGLSPKNIVSELDKIDSAQTQKVDVWIDAEYGLRNKDKNVLDLSKAQEFVDLIWSWQNEGQSGDTAK